MNEAEETEKTDSLTIVARATDALRYTTLLFFEIYINIQSTWFYKQKKNRNEWNINFHIRLLQKSKESAEKIVIANTSHLMPLLSPMYRCTICMSCTFIT